MATLGIGLGAAPLGSSSLGTGVPATADSPAQPSTNEALQIDQFSRRYVVDSDGTIARTTRARQIVYLAIFTEFGSSAQADLGLQKDPRVITEKAPTEMQDRVRRALKSAVDQGLIAVLSISVVRSAKIRTRMERRVLWVDLSTSEEQTTTF